jgi:RND superfamily putative drug exporter
VVGLTIFTIVMSMAVSSAVAPKLLEDDDGGLDKEAAEAAQLVDDRFEFGVEDIEQLVFTHPAYDADQGAYRTVVEGLVEELRALPEVASAVSYYDTGDREGMVADDGHVQRVEIIVADSGEIAGPEADLEDAERVDPIVETVRAAREDAEAAGFTIDIAGDLSIDTETEKMADEDLARVLIISLGLGLIFMLLVFRAVVAAVIPLTLAIGAMIIANGIAAVVSQSYPLVDMYTEMITLLGLAVGIDYSLFIVSRFRSERKAGRPKLEAISVASNTTGRAVFYAGITVLLSLTGLVLTFNAIFISLALGAIFVVAVAIVGALTTLPAVLALLGDNINRLRVPFLGRANGDGLWSHIVSRVMARPGLFAGVTAAVLIAAALPALTLDLGFPTGSSALHDDMETKKAVLLLEEHFTGGLADPAYLVVDAPDVTTPEVQAAVAQFVEAVSRNSAFYPAAEPMVNPAGDTLFIAVPLSGDKDANEAAVNLLRNEIVPDAFDGTSARGLITGNTAFSMDFTEAMFESTPYVFGFTLGLAFLLLLVMFRSIVIPVKAILLNLLSVGAAYGILVVIFQWGIGVELLGSEAGPIGAWLPLFLFAILFGLSMDYHMLLLNRIKEGHDKGLSTDESVEQGIRLTAGQITSAAAIMVGVFGAFALGRNVGMQQFGIGLGVAVLVDATVIRSILLPASMKLLGDINWYLPKWLEWLPDVSVEGPEAEETPEFAPATQAIPVGAAD